MRLGAPALAASQKEERMPEAKDVANGSAGGGAPEDGNVPADAGGQAEEPDAVATPAPPATGWTAGLREIMTSAIAVVILAVTTVMLWKVFQAGGVKAVDPEAFNRQKDIMHYGLTLLGTVLGYYFGRVPAERRAEQAEAVAHQANAAVGEAAGAASEAQRQSREHQQQRQAAEAKVEDAKTTVARVRERLTPAPQTRRGTLGAAGAPEDTGTRAESHAAAHAELHALAQRL